MEKEIREVVAVRQCAMKIAKKLAERSEDEEVRDALKDHELVLHALIPPTHYMWKRSSWDFGKQYKTLWQMMWDYNDSHSERIMKVQSLYLERILWLELMDDLFDIIYRSRFNDREPYLTYEMIRNWTVQYSSLFWIEDMLNTPSRTFSEREKLRPNEQDRPTAAVMDAMLDGKSDSEAKTLLQKVKRAIPGWEYVNNWTTSGWSDFEDD